MRKHCLLLVQLPSTYLYDDQQYIILHVSGGTTLQKGYPNLVETGNKLIAFKLKM